MITLLHRSPGKKATRFLMAQAWKTHLLLRGDHGEHDLLRNLIHKSQLFQTVINRFTSKHILKIPDQYGAPLWCSALRMQHCHCSRIRWPAIFHMSLSHPAVTLRPQAWGTWESRFRQQDRSTVHTPGADLGFSFLMSKCIRRFTETPPLSKQPRALT